MATILETFDFCNISSTNLRGINKAFTHSRLSPAAHGYGEKSDDFNTHQITMSAATCRRIACHSKFARPKTKTLGMEKSVL
jgi:hypothetical protein